MYPRCSVCTSQPWQWTEEWVSWEASKRSARYFIEYCFNFGFQQLLQFQVHFVDPFLNKKKYRTSHPKTNPESNRTNRLKRSNYSEIMHEMLRTFLRPSSSPPFVLFACPSSCNDRWPSSRPLSDTGDWPNSCVPWPRPASVRIWLKIVFFFEIPKTAGINKCTLCSHKAEYQKKIFNS